MQNEYVCVCVCVSLKRNETNTHEKKNCAERSLKIIKLIHLETLNCNSLNCFMQQYLKKNQSAPAIFAFVF